MIEPGDVILFKVDPSSWVSRLVSLVTGSDYTHVALAIGTKEIVEANFLIKTRVTPLDTSRDFIVLRSSASLDLKKRVVSRALKFKGSSYDYLRALGVGLKHLFKLRITYLMNLTENIACIELVDKAFYYEGINLLPEEELGHVLPHDFLYSKQLRVVYINAYTREEVT